MKQVVHTKCQGTNLGVCTLVPRTQAVSEWHVDGDGSFEVLEYDGAQDDAFWDCEDPDPSGGYWCYDCLEQFNEDQLEVTDG